MDRLSTIVGAALMCGLATQALTAQERPAPASTELARAVAGDPPATPQRLRLVDRPRATGPARDLFNGRDLSDWEGWLGYPDPAVTYRDDPGSSAIGTARRIEEHFAVRTVDGAPALWIKGETWGSLVHRADLRDYHLRLEFKWGAKTYAPRETQAQNNGLLYHTHGQPGAVFGTWSPSVEFEIMRGSTGMIVTVGKDVRARTTVAYDPGLIEPHLRYRLGGREVDMINRTPTWNVEAGVDAERPVGQWNTLDLYVVGDRAVHVVNGVPVATVKDLAVIAPDGSRQALTHGRIQLQSEGAETWFRNITVEPIKALPRIVAR
ncbi:3-keto-disaccharide hydrolase [Sphingomonas radiodurans]|uniref:3-keto-disaccharide hydrolase n=1 Tax=Sphingomonas radiodurans TaxID=2890321 RepID=UPI001E52F41F|nr:DUF1080 domain-containing protein [Sphingomonas radiodurans]WBH15525.1 DUF1080 domain-containing protein [Sphingomonas radiodurans]